MVHGRTPRHGDSPRDPSDYVHPPIRTRFPLWYRWFWRSREQPTKPRQKLKMDLERIATTKLNDTNVYLARSEFDDLLIIAEVLNQPDHPGPQADPNCYILQLDHPVENKFKLIDRQDQCAKCGTEDNFTYILTGYLETDPDYIRTHTKEKLCTNCSEKPINTLLTAYETFKENITAVEL